MTEDKKANASPAAGVHGGRLGLTGGLIALAPMLIALLPLFFHH